MSIQTRENIYWGKEIKKKMLDYEIVNADLCQMLGKSKQYISRCLRGFSTSPAVKEKIERAVDELKRLKKDEKGVEKNGKSREY